MATERPRESRRIGLLVADLVVLFMAGSTFFDNESYPTAVYLCAGALCVLALVFAAQSERRILTHR